MALTLNLSKLERDEEGNRKPRQLVLTCTCAESYDVQALLYQQVLRPNGLPVCVPRRNQQRDVARFRMRSSLLSQVQMTFPYAHTSPGLHSRLMKAARREYEDIEVPDITVPGLATDALINGELMGHQKIAIKEITDWLSGEVEDTYTLTHVPHSGYAGPTSDSYFLNDEMGLGKTLVALSVRRLLARQLRADPDYVFRTLIVVPNNIKYTSWMQDIDKFFPSLDYGIIDSDEQTMAQRVWLIENEDLQVVIVNWESLWRIPQIQDIEWDFLIADEYHRAKNSTARQSLAFQALQFQKGLFMSGTGILNGRPEELWTVLNRAWPQKFPDINYFTSEHVVKQRGRKVTAYKNLDKLQKMLRTSETRRRKDQVMRDLPEKIYNRILVPMGPDQRRIYDRILDEMTLERIDPDTGTVHITPVVNVLSQLTRLKQACFSPELFEGRPRSSKVDEVKRIVAEMSDQGEKVIIFSQWARATRILKRELAEYNPAYVDGDVKVSKRADEVNQFQNDPECKVFIGTIASCKEGITLTAGSYVIFTDKGWTPAENEQAAARAHRIGQARTVHVLEIFTQDSIEAEIEDLLQRKQNVFNNLMERDGGQRNMRIESTDVRDIIRRARGEEVVEVADANEAESEDAA